MLTERQKTGVFVACALGARNPEVAEAVLAEFAPKLNAGELAAAKAAAALMAMNNVYYRFRHMIGKPAYSEKPARLRMSRLARPSSNQVDFELFSLAVSAINGCETCMRSHEAVVIEGGLTEDQVHDAIRLAATINATAVSLEIAAGPATQRREAAV